MKNNARKSNRALKWVVVICLLMPAFVLTYSHFLASPIKTVAASGSDPASSVGVVRVTRETLTNRVTLAAEFKPYQQIDVHAKVAGYVKDIAVDVGDRVTKGQLLATLEIPEFQDDLENAVAGVRRAEEEVKRADAELERSKSAHEIAHLSFTRLSGVLKVQPNLIAEQEIDDAQARDRVSEAQVSTDEAALAAAREQLEEAKANEGKVKTLQAYSQITAPFSGVITRRYADTGAMIQAGTASNTQSMPLVQLSQNDRLRLVLPVPGSIVPKIQIGTPVEVQVQSLGKSIRGTVSRFAQKLDLSTRTMETEVDVPNPQLLLMPGMYATAILDLDRRENALTLPVQAISGSGTKTTVLIVDSSKRIEERQVTLGIETPTKFEVVSGLKEGDLVVVGSRSQLSVGQTVEPKVIKEDGAGGER